MLTEMNGKGGNLCPQARDGAIHCPLIVRPTSEDVITGHLFQMLGYLNPRWWVADLLNIALGGRRFSRQFHRRFKIDLWQNQPCYPRDLLPWDEGSTQVDAVLNWENRPTTVFIEAKYASPLSGFVSGDDGSSGYPSDQLVRNIRVGLHRCGYFRPDGQLFDQPPRDFVVLLLSPTKGHALVQRYRDPEILWSAIPHSDRLNGLPRGPFVGELDYSDIIGLLQLEFRWFDRPQRVIAADLIDYLQYKLTTRPTRLQPLRLVDAGRNEPAIPAAVLP